MAGDRVAFAPTMGNLHAGHMSLAALCAQTAPRVVMSIFVNPTQFGPSEDFAAYPRTLAADEAVIAAAGNVDLLFVPDTAEIYPFGLEQAVRVQLPALSRELCGASRPGHFDGVATVVCRLLNIVMPDVLFLGQKDYQQFVLMQRMIADLALPVELRMGPTQREPDGLALSSRNRYLGADERKRAPALYLALARVRERVLGGERDFARLRADARADLERAGFVPDYVEIRRRGDLSAADPERTEERVVLGAARLGRTRLIDNLFV
jgi:pantoate--beta-alanine ligase